MRAIRLLLALLCCAACSVQRAASFAVLPSSSRTTTAGEAGTMISTMRTKNAARVGSKTNTLRMARISKERRDQLGIGDDEDEYDLGVALNTNTDPLISKIIAGSLIVVILGLLVAGVIVPITTDYGDGVCNPLLTGGRC